VKKEQQSVTDFLFQYMRDPVLDQTHELINTKESYVDPKAANALYNVWKNRNNHIRKQTYKIPDNLSKTELNKMVDAGLIKHNLDTVEITANGADIIKIMILGNDKSIFESSSDIDYVTAMKNVKAKKKKKNVGESNLDWWGRFDGVFE